MLAAEDAHTPHDCYELFLPKTFGVDFTSVGGTLSSRFGNASTVMVGSAVVDLQLLQTGLDPACCLRCRRYRAK